MSTILVWLHRDLRLADNPALHRAVADGDAVVPVYVWAPEEEAGWAPGAAARWYLHGSLERLAADLEATSSRLVVRRGASGDELAELVEATGADAVYWNRRHEPALAERDVDVARRLHRRGVRVSTFEGRILHDPDRLRTATGDPYRVFTPFWRKLRETLVVDEALPRPVMGPAKAPARWPASMPLAALGFRPEVAWTEGLAAAWTPGEAAAVRRLERFVADLLDDYPAHRDLPAVDGTSRLSPYLAHGELSPRQVWSAVARSGGDEEAVEAYLRQLAWREFSYHCLVHVDDFAEQPMRRELAAFGWRDAPRELEAWREGRTGYPMVDAGMRQLRRTGWMHNRTRLLVASFLTKDLLVPWQQGAAWFWDTLVDADLADNAMGWQWTAGSGPDAQPFFRVFNPVTQGQRFDPDGNYVRTWVPELANLPDRHLFAPWEAPAAVLAAAGVRLGVDYPHPLVDHAAARERALEEYRAIR